MTSDVLDEALERYATTGPEFGPGLSNHGPMASEALVAMGRDDAVTPWSEWYVRRLRARPDARNPIVPGEWREALGDIGRVGDWTLLFQREIDERPWREVLETWVGRLAPGVVAAATHGVIRTAHAVRSLERGETAERLRELAEALAYWAARYQELPTREGASGSALPGEALLRVVRIDPSLPRVGLITHSLKLVEGTQFDEAIAYVAVDGDPDAFITDLTRTFVRQYLANADTAAIALIHSVTAPRALRVLAPHLTDDTRRSAMRYTWQACASLYAVFGAPADQVATAPVEVAEFDRDDLIDQAVAARDEHAIKFTEACLREYELSGDPAFVAGAQDVVRRLRARG